MNNIIIKTGTMKLILEIDIGELGMDGMKQ